MKSNFPARRPLAAFLLAAAAIALPSTSFAQQDHQYSAAEIEIGSRIYSTQCVLCHGPNGELVNGIDLRRGQFRRASSDEDLAGVIQNGVPGAGMPAFKLAAGEVTALVAFIRAGFDTSGITVRLGDATRGRAVFESKGGCLSCHRVNGVGSRTGPDLSDVGAVRSPAALQRSLLEPSRGMMPINRPVEIITKDGRTVRGRRLNEDTFTVQIIDDQERLQSFEKSALREIRVSTTSTMPSVQGKLSAEEQADLVAYLLSLKGSL